LIGLIGGSFGGSPRRSAVAGLFDDCWIPAKWNRIRDAALPGSWRLIAPQAPSGSIQSGGLPFY
jgi:hypothetical protein